jgi:autocrine motility factor receptor
MTLNRQQSVDDEIEQLAGGGNATNNQNAVRNNHFFHFNGQRYISWLPNFSVEVSNFNSVLRNGHLAATIIQQQQQQQQTSQLRNMARHIQEMFPHYTLDALIADLQVTHSIEQTIDNILEGRLPAPRIIEDEQQGQSSSGSFDYYNSEEEGSSSSSTDQYEIEQHGSDSMFGNRQELLRDGSPETQILDDPWNSPNFIPSMDNLGDRFSKSSQEREKILQRRKEQMLLIARKR